MLLIFVIAAIVAIFSTIMVITRLNAIHALLYLIVSLLAVAVIFFIMGAPFVGALEIIVYAGAIMVLFIFVVMMLNLGQAATEQEKKWFTPGIWIGPSLLAGILAALFISILLTHPGQQFSIQVLSPKQIGLSLFGPYLLAVELAAMLLLGGIVGAHHLGHRIKQHSTAQGES